MDFGKFLRLRKMLCCPRMFLRFCVALILALSRLPLSSEGKDILFFSFLFFPVVSLHLPSAAPWQCTGAGVAVVSQWTWRASRSHVPPFCWITGCLPSPHPRVTSSNTAAATTAAATGPSEPERAGGTCGLSSLSLVSRLEKEGRVLEKVGIQFSDAIGENQVLLLWSWWEFDVLPLKWSHHPGVLWCGIWGQPPTSAELSLMPVLMIARWIKRPLGDVGSSSMCVAPSFWERGRKLCSCLVQGVWMERSRVRHVTRNLSKWFLNSV